MKLGMLAVSICLLGLACSQEPNSNGDVHVDKVKEQPKVEVKVGEDGVGFKNKDVDIEIGH